MTTAEFMQAKVIANETNSVEEAVAEARDFYDQAEREERHRILIEKLDAEDARWASGEVVAVDDDEEEDEEFDDEDDLDEDDEDDLDDEDEDDEDDLDDEDDDFDDDDFDDDDFDEDDLEDDEE